MKSLNWKDALAFGNNRLVLHVRANVHYQRGCVRAFILLKITQVSWWFTDKRTDPTSDHCGKTGQFEVWIYTHETNTCGKGVLTFTKDPVVVLAGLVHDLLSPGRWFHLREKGEKRTLVGASRSPAALTKPLRVVAMPERVVLAEDAYRSIQSGDDLEKVKINLGRAGSKLAKLRRQKRF